MNDTLPKILFGLALLLAAFAYGVVAVEQQIFPYPAIRLATATWQDLRENWKNDLQLQPTRHLKPARHEGDGVTVRDDGSMQPGPTFMTGLFGDQMGARLLGADGTVIHEWPVSYTAIWPKRKARRSGGPATDWNVFLHGSLALPDGSIVFNFDQGASLVRMDRCGKVTWKIDQNIHHAVFRAEDGTFWVPLADDVAQISEDGEVLRRISIKKMIKKHDLLGVLFIQHPTDAKLHPNDVEVLPAAMADAFPSFEAGDVVYSMRDLNLLLVFDPDEQRVKWYRHGPWLRQHDPDFLPDGRISVFNNRMGYDYSNIMTVDPVSGAVEVAYEAPKRGSFYTAIRGKHQYLGNGNILITEADAGRVFEVTPGGRIVWEFVNRYDRARVAVISNAIRYAPDYFEVDDWSRCDS